MKQFSLRLIGAGLSGMVVSLGVMMLPFFPALHPWAALTTSLSFLLAFFGVLLLILCLASEPLASSRRRQR